MHEYLFLVPWEDRVYAGTTDTPYAGDLDRPAVDDGDRDYILSAVARYFPAVTGHDVVASWAGLRPLLSQGQTAKRMTCRGNTGSFGSCVVFSPSPAGSGPPTGP